MGKIIITGPGRSGTSFLMRLLTRLDFDTGYTTEEDGFDPSIRAGCEFTSGMIIDLPSSILKNEIDKWPRILKAPDWCFFLRQFIEAGALSVDHVFIPVRKIEEAAKSRIDAGLEWMAAKGDYESQIMVCCAALGKILETCVTMDIPYTIMKYPKIVKDHTYLWNCLNGVLDFSNIEHTMSFLDVFDSLTTI